MHVLLTNIKQMLLCFVIFVSFCFDFVVVAFREGGTNRSCQKSYAFE